MPPRSVRPKDLTWQQLRSFCEAARLGSLSAAAESLGLAQPTVWAQVHALERQLGCRLLETHTKGCRLTHEGKLLIELAGPTVAGIGRLQEVFRERLAMTSPRLRVATTPRTLMEELPSCITAFEQGHQEARLSLVEMANATIVPAIVAGKADIGLTTWVSDEESMVWVQKVPCYQLRTLLITPIDHPLARKKKIEPSDLREYPVVNSPDNITGDPAAHAALLSIGGYDHQERRMEAFYVASIRRFVELGFGIGLISALASKPETRTWHERDMSHVFGRTTVFAVTRSDSPLTSLTASFIDTVRETMTPIANRE